MIFKLKRYHINTLIFALIFSLLAGMQAAVGESATTETADKQPLSVVSTIFPGYDFTRAIAGDAVKLTMLLSPGSESHSYEPTPQDIITIQNCDVFIYVGGESDTWVGRILDSMDTSHITILPMISMVDTVGEEIKEGMQAGHDHGGEDHDHDDGHDETEHAEHDHEEEAELDEHVWTSPLNAIRITEAIADTLCTLDEGNAGTYRANTAAYVQELHALDASFREVISNATRKTLIFGDRFPFRYFVREYGLDYYAAFPGCSTETEPSAKTVSFLIDKVMDEQIPVVFHIEFSNEKMANTISEATSAKSLLFHSCHNVSKTDFESGATYLMLMQRNADHLKEALY